MNIIIKFTSSFIRISVIRFSPRISPNPARKSKKPWPKSPNMMPKRNGKVIIVNGAELKLIKNIHFNTWINFPIGGDCI